MTYLSSYDYELLADALDALEPDGSAQTARKSELEAWARSMAATGLGYLPPAQPGVTAPPIRVLVALEGGLVQGAVADVAGVRVIVVDYDTEGADLDGVYSIPQDGGGTAEACRSEHAAEHDPAFIDGAEAAEFADLQGAAEEFRKSAKRAEGWSFRTEEDRARYVAAQIAEAERLEALIAEEEEEEEEAAA